MDLLSSDILKANNASYKVETFVPANFLQMWSWEHYRAYRSEVTELDFVGERVMTAEDASERVVTNPISYP